MITPGCGATPWLCGITESTVNKNPARPCGAAATTAPFCARNVQSAGSSIASDRSAAWRRTNCAVIGRSSRTWMLVRMSSSSARSWGSRAAGAR
jgi:hypothetical protein